MGKMKELEYGMAHLTQDNWWMNKAWRTSEQKLLERIVFHQTSLMNELIIDKMMAFGLTNEQAAYNMQTAIDKTHHQLSEDILQYKRMRPQYQPKQTKLNRQLHTAQHPMVNDLAQILKPRGSR